MNPKSILAAGYLIIAGCINDPSWSNSPVQQSVRNDGIVFTLNLPNNTFQLSDSLRGSFQVTNESGQQWTVGFSNIQQLGIEIRKLSGDVVFSRPGIVSPALSSLSLSDGESRLYQISYPFRNFDSKYIETGQYILKVFLLDNNSPPVATMILVK